MAIYRGAGGAGDAVADTSNQSASAVASAAAAATSAANAATSATNASNSATAAASSASAASSSASSASSSASSASSSASSASTSATNAANSATAAQTAETNAETAETNAETAQAAAEVAQAAAEAAQSAAETAQAAAELAETNAETAETNAETAETNAAASAIAASTSATNASNSASAASASASAASTSETNASASEAAAAASEAAAATSESNAASSASTASTAATNASNSASAAATSASNAASSASSAASSASAASASADAALSALDSFDDRYLGQKTSDPTLDNDGNALVAGALYFNTTDNSMKVYDGSTWLAAYASLSGALIASNNLSDLSSVSSARTNLGLGTAATTDSTAYATSAQGALADSATQPGDNVSTLTNDAGYLTSYTETDPVFSASEAASITSTDTTNWDTAYGWGNHASAGYQAAATALTTSTSFGGDVSGTYNAIVIADDSHNHIIGNVDGLQTALDGKQPIDADLTAIAGLAGTSGFLKKTAANTWSLDTSTYLTGNQTITLSGDVSGSGTTNISVTVADDSHNHIIGNVDGLQTALDAKAPLASPTFTGTPAAPTAATGTNTTQLATTAFVNAEIANDAPTKTGTGASGTWGISITGNAATATSAGTWTTARTFTIGSTGKSVDGSANVSWTLAEITGTTAAPQFGSLGIGTAASGTTGEIRATNNVTAYYSSDARLKENVKDVDNALDKVCAIGSKTFDWTDEYIASKGGEDGYFIQKADFGVVAQDVQSVFPQAVRTREDGTLAVDYEKLATLAFGAIKELVKRVEALESK